MSDRFQPEQDPRPSIITWEPTRACDLACRHCRAAVQSKRSRFELSTYESYKLVDQVVKLRPNQFFITGGDPLLRADLYQLVDYANRRNLPPIINATASPNLTEEAIVQLKRSGASAIAMSLDGSSANTHDSFRGWPGSFHETIEIIHHARSVELPVEINTLITRRNLPEVEAIIDLLSSLDIRTWRLFFLVPTGQARRENMISAEETEILFGTLYEASLLASFRIETSEANHYRRFILQRKLETAGISLDQILDSRGVIDLGAIDGQLGSPDFDLKNAEATDSLFISHTGEVTISGFLPVAGGNVHYESLASIWLDSSLFKGLRNRDEFEGKCGKCEFRNLCAGSRARAYALYKNAFESDPLCAYQPA